MSTPELQSRFARTRKGSIVRRPWPGDYQFTVSKRGFKEILKPQVTLHVADTVSMNFTMQVGDASEVVTVEAGAPLINTTDGSVSTVIDRNFVSQLPLNGRSFNTLLQLTPGVVIAPSNESGFLGSSASLVRGRMRIISLLRSVRQFWRRGQLGLGAVWDRWAQAFSALGGTSSLVCGCSAGIPDRDFILRSRIWANARRSSDPHTRSGTNTFHGGAFDYFAIRSWTQTTGSTMQLLHQSSVSRTTQRLRRLPGWTDLEGQDILFLSYEGARLRQPQTHLVQVPSTFARNCAPAAVAPFLNAYPLPMSRPRSRVF